MLSSVTSNTEVPHAAIPLHGDLAQWIERAAAGDREGQRRIYDLIGPRVYRVIRKIVGEGAADDVLQDFMIHLFSKIGQFRFESSLETWAHRMAVNQALSYLRKDAREAERIRKFSQVQSMVEKESPNTQQENAEILESALANITGEQRALLHMKEVEGLGYQNIAEVLGVPTGTVGSRLNKARKDLRSALLSLGWEA